MARKQTPISDAVRNAIEASGITRYRIAKDLGWSQATLTRFMSGERGLTMKALDELAVYLNLRIVAGKRK